MFLFLVAGLQLPLRQSGARASVCVSRINVLTRDPQAAQSPVPSRSESAAKQPPESAHFLPAIAIQTSHRDDDDTRGSGFQTKPNNALLYKKGEAKTLCRKMPPTFFQFKHQFAIVKRRLGREFCGGHAQPCTVCPGFSGGVLLQPQHKKPMELTRFPPPCLEGEGRDWTSGKELSEPPVTPK